MHEFGSVPKSRVQTRKSTGFFAIFVCFLQGIVNQKNTIKSLIPQRLLNLVPSSVRDKWANRIVEKVKDSAPALYDSIGEWSYIPEEKVETLVAEILAAAEKIHWEIQDENK